MVSLRHGFINSRSALLLALVFCIGSNFWNHHQCWWNARNTHRVSHICDIWRRWSENTSPLIPFSLKATSVITSITEILTGPSKCFMSSCTNLNVDSGSSSCYGSNLKHWHQLLLRPKIQTLAGVRYQVKFLTLFLFFSYFASQNKEITSGNSFFDVCCVS